MVRIENKVHESGDDSFRVRLTGALVPDTTPPAFARATVDGTTLIITYDEDLNDSPLPSATDYAIAVGSASAVSPSTVAISGKRVTLTPAAEDAPSHGGTVTISYTAGTNPVEDTAGNDAADITGQTVDNLTHSADQVTFVGNHTRANDGFRSVGNGAGVIPQLAQKFTTGTAQRGYALEAVTLHIGRAGASAHPRVAIAAANGDDPSSTLYTLLAPDTFSAELQTFTAPANAALDPETEYLILVTNDSTTDHDDARFSVRTTGGNGEDGGGQAGWGIADDGRRKSGNLAWEDIQSVKVRLSGLVNADTTPPTLSTATVMAASLVLTYDETLDPDSKPATTAFTVTSDGAEVTVNDVSVSGRAVTLTLASALNASQTILVSYTVPTSNPIQDLAENAAAALTSQSVEASNLRPSITGESTISVPENTAPGVDIGDPYTATDDDGDTVTYSLSGRDGSHFAVTQRGQIQTSGGAGPRDQGQVQPEGEYQRRQERRRRERHVHR